MTLTISMTKTTDKTIWDAFVENAKGGTYFQTTAFARLYSDYYKQTAYFATAEEDGNRIGQLLFFVGPPQGAVNHSNPLIRIGTRIGKGLFRRIHWIYGPLVDPKADYCKVLDALLKATIKKKTLLGHQTVFPPVYDTENQKEIVNAYKKSGFASKQIATIINRPSLGAQTAWDHLSKKDRAAINRAKRKGITVHQITSQSELREGIAVYLENRKRNGIDTHMTEDWFLRIWNDAEFRSAHRFFVTRHQNRVVSFQALTVWKNIMYQSAISISNYALEKGLHGNDLLQWYLIEWGAKQGYEINDLAGYFINPSTHSQKGINNFKKRWGTEVLEFATFSRKTPIANMLMQDNWISPVVDENTTIESEEEDQDFAQMPFGDVIENQYSYLEKTYSISSKMSKNELTHFLTKAESAGADNHQIVQILERYLTSGDEEFAFQAIGDKEKQRAIIERYIQNHPDMLQKGKHSIGKIMHNLREEIGETFDGKLANKVLQEHMNEK